MPTFRHWIILASGDIEHGEQPGVPCVTYLPGKMGESAILIFVARKKDI